MNLVVERKDLAKLIILQSWNFIAPFSKNPSSNFVSVIPSLITSVHKTSSGCATFNPYISVHPSIPFPMTMSTGFAGRHNNH